MRTTKAKVDRRYVDGTISTEQVAQKQLHDESMRAEVEAVLKEFRKVLARRQVKHASKPPTVPEAWPEMFDVIFAQYANGIGDAHTLIEEWLERFRFHSTEAIAFDPTSKH